jgi:hypothetical protein
VGFGPVGVKVTKPGLLPVAVAIAAGGLNVLERCAVGVGPEAVAAAAPRTVIVFSFVTVAAVPLAVATAAAGLIVDVIVSVAAVLEAVA